MTITVVIVFAGISDFFFCVSLLYLPIVSHKSSETFWFAFLLQH